MPGFTRLRMPESVTVHEFGHNFFQGMIASNEFEEAWIDEGMNSYYEAVVMEEHYGTMLELFGLRAAPSELDRLQLGDGSFSDAVVQPSWSYRTGGSYGLNSYARPAVTLRHLRNLLGPETFDRAMRRFFQTWRFRHPSTADFERIIFEASSGELGWFLEQALHSDRALDYRVRSASSSRDRGSHGWFRDEEGGMTLLGEIDRPHADEHADGPGHDEPGSDAEGAKDGDDSDAEDTLYRSVVVVDRVGEFVHPVTVELVFADGETLRREWDGRDRWLRIVEERPAKLVSAEVDPEHLMVLDVDPLNNSRRLEPDRRPATKLLAHLVFWLQNLFAVTAVVG
ncbi:MAG TPA: M1 family aminopeptidase [Candidatus Sulfomarinibacteraceae bacterium]|nr:M1 family aminopeptidase [Candidatus Sulfomarinibacteraceae bacterium]